MSISASSSPQRREGWSIGRRGNTEGDSPEASSVLDESESPRSSRTPSESFLTQLDEEFKGQIKGAKFTSRVPVTGQLRGRIHHTSVQYEDFMFVFGGRSTEEEYLGDLTCFHFATRSWSSIENENACVVPRHSHTAVVYGDSMFVYGGKSKTGVLEDLVEFKFETQSWSTIQGDGTKPGTRYGHSAVIHENAMYIFGGRDNDDKTHNDIFEFRFDTLRWTKITPGGHPPPPRFYHSLVVFKDSIYLFGGSDGSAKLSDFYEYKIKGKSWSPVILSPSPSPRDGHTAVTFQNSMYLAGGGDTHLMEIFEFDYDFRKWFRVQPLGDVPSLKQFATSVVRGDCIFFLGGKDFSSDLDYICLGKDEFEEEFELDEMAKMQNVPSSMWETTAMRKHPSILEMRERLRPLTNNTSFARLVASSKTEAKTGLTHSMILQLIMEHLDHDGLSSVINTIEEESSVKYQKQNNPESQLITLLRIGRRRLRHKDVFGPDIMVADFDEGDPEVEVVDHLPGRIEDKEEDENIWDDPPESRHNMIKVQGENSDRLFIRAATLNKLVQYLTSEKEKVHDVQFMRTFLYTYQSFTTPETLLKKLIQRYHVPHPKDLPEERFKSELQTPIRSRVCTVIKYWVDKCGWDFNEKMVAALNAFIDGPLSRDGNLSLVKQLRNSLAKLLKKRNVNEEERSYVFGVNPPEPKVPKNIFSPTVSLKDIDEVEIARQLTLIDFDIFSQIAPTELLNKSWTDPDLKHRSPHLLQIMHRHETIVHWVTHTIVTVQDNRKNRARMIEKYIRIAENLKTLKNYQTLFAIVAGLTSPSINRLTQTMAEVPLRPREVLNDLQTIISKESNFKTYRDLLRYTALPCLPYVDALLKDLLVIEEQHPDTVNNLINFQKRQILFKTIVMIQGYQQRPFNLQPVQQIATFLSDFPLKSDRELLELSHKCEPIK